MDKGQRRLVHPRAAESLHDALGDIAWWKLDGPEARHHLARIAYWHRVMARRELEREVRFQTKILRYSIGSAVLLGGTAVLQLAATLGRYFL